ncbi:MAG: hypothetical protein HZA54_12475 [Planctomycetes bacterium]|nr:hypothetical protein [Planctomycetota bacterium]
MAQERAGSLGFRLTVGALLLILLGDLGFGIVWWRRHAREARRDALEARFVHGQGAEEFSWGVAEDRALVLELLGDLPENRVLLGLALLTADPADPAIPREAPRALERLLLLGSDRVRVPAALALGQAARHHRAPELARLQAALADPRATIRLALLAGLFDGVVNLEPGVGHAMSQPDRAELVLAGFGPEQIRDLLEAHAGLTNAALAGAVGERFLPVAVRLRAAVVLAQRRDLAPAETASLAAALAVLGAVRATPDEARLRDVMERALGR